MSEIYYRGTAGEFTTWHDWVCTPDRENIPSEGKINFVEGRPAPNNQRTMSYSEKISHLSNENDYIWLFGNYDTLQLPKITEEEAVSLGYFEAPEE